MTLADENRIRLAVARATERGATDGDLRNLLWDLLKTLAPGGRK